ncbi:phosphoribosyltransferase [Haliea sp. E17]|uniref:phosphoribosyltransferase n=1 Tax=Haliea sp. E17 TaxID=3401576 RepID=UPI003AAE9149
MNKIFLTADDLLHDSYRLAQLVYESGFRPNFIIGVWRGGAPVGIAVQEFLDYIGVKTDHIAIRTSSYTGINQQEKTVRVHGLHYIIDNVNAEDKVLLVDDVFDSGRSLRATLAELKDKCRRNLPATIRIACPWYKPNKNVTDIRPDYYVHETDDWLVFPHELKGLTLDEICAGKGRVADPLAQCLRNARGNAD